MINIPDGGIPILVGVVDGPVVTNTVVAPAATSVIEPLPHTILVLYSKGKVIVPFFNLVFNDLY